MNALYPYQPYKGYKQFKSATVIFTYLTIDMYFKKHLGKIQYINTQEPSITPRVMIHV